MIPAKQPLTCLFTFLALACSSCSSENVGHCTETMQWKLVILAYYQIVISSDAQKRKEEAGGEYAFSIYLNIVIDGCKRVY